MEPAVDPIVVEPIVDPVVEPAVEPAIEPAVVPTVELLDNLAPGEIPAYAALYYNNDCTGDYFNAEIDPVTL